MPRFRSSAEQFLPHALVATIGVVVVPALAVSFIEPAGRPWLVLSSVLLAMVLSVAAATLGSALWTRRSKSTDLVFGDLMLWGLLRRVRAERRLEQAQEQLRRGAGARNGQELSLEHRRKILQRLAAMLDAKDAYTLGHSRRVARHAERIAREMGLAREDVAKIRLAASVHDIGKVHTPRRILTKSGSLIAEELTVMQQHPVDGARMVAELGDPEITAMVRYHHERLDGSGYPEGLRGEDIPLGSRIISVADTFDAITSNRVYQGACKHRRALEVVSEEAGGCLDPDAVAAFLRYYSGRREVAWSAFGLTGTSRLASWIAGLAGGAGGWASPLAQGLAAIVAATLAGAALGGQPATATPTPTATSGQAPPGASGAASTGAARTNFAPAADRRTEAAPGRRLAPIVERPGNGVTPDVPSDESPGAPGSGDGTGGGPPVDTSPSPAVQVPSHRVPSGDEPAVERPVTVPLELRVPQLEVPQLEVPQLKLPQLEVPLEVPPIEAPPLHVPLSQLVPGAQDLNVSLPKLR